MGAPWLEHPSWEVVDEASQIVGRDVGKLLLEAPASELVSTANAQLATFVLSSVILDAIERVGLVPTLCAGHSLGEYTALTAAGAIGFEDGVRLVAERGAAMHDAAEERPGTMAAVLGADDDRVDAACRRAEGDVWVANYNAPGQVVIAGEAAAVERAGALARELGARKVMALPVAGAFHTSLMAPARDRLAKALASTDFADAEVPVVTNVDARAHREGRGWASLLSAQLCSPVRWHQSLATLADLGATVMVEVGAGGVLAGLTRRVLPQVRSVGIAGPDDLDTVVDAASGTDSWHAYATAHQGERLFGTDRVVVAPSAGVFCPDAQLAAVPGPGALNNTGPVVAAATVEVGDLVGTVGPVEVRTPFGGSIVGFLAHSGERVVGGQPVAWLRVSAADV